MPVTWLGRISFEVSRDNSDVNRMLQPTEKTAGVDTVLDLVVKYAVLFAWLVYAGGLRPNLGFSWHVKRAYGHGLPYPPGDRKSRRFSGLDDSSSDSRQLVFHEFGE